ncbi:ABC transporter permease [Flavobacteriaceae bacterium F89]|uniref:ABC transporter permease n=1 Tax=Cerina litoralis TaxID=2874477 RepID=A0AAE3ES67_9FLAO|nr:ABC transporter permease [Cerina litoralis]MCG2460085.1 ABC transporter permease [Cerina litoralis]
MIKNYFKIAFRNLKKNKGYAVINIGGLAIGMLCSILILLWVLNETSYDKFHNNSNSIYRLTTNVDDLNFKTAVTPAGMSEELQSEIPEIVSTVRLSKPVTGLFEVGMKKFEEQHVFYADANFLDMFTFPLLEGDPKTALASPDDILITEKTARKYFGNESALGKVIRKDNGENFIVSGVLADVPSNSHLQFDIILPMSHLAKTNRDLITKTWGNFNFYTYIQFNKSAISTSSSISNLAHKINDLYLSKKQKVKVDFQLQHLTDIHLHSNLQIDLAGQGNIQYVNVFFIVAIVILIVACINFMNLATARSSRRAKEVGLRKVIGAKKTELIIQFLSESVLISFMALLIALGLVYLLLPAFNDLVGKELNLNLLDWKGPVALIVMTLLTGLFAGSYPALLLSSFTPIRVLKGKIKLGGRDQLFRNSLVISQFVVSVVLLIGTAVIYTQLNFIKDKNLGFNKENLIYIPMKGEVWGKQDALKTALLQNPLTEDFTVVSNLPANLATGTIDVQWEGRDPNSQILFPNIDVDDRFLEVFGMETITGRGFSKEFKSDSSNYVINEKAMQVMGMDIKNAVGKTLSFSGRKGTIVGVVKDFNFKPLQYAIEPLVLRLNKYGGIVVVRTTTGNTKTTIAALEKIYATLNPAYPFAYNFIDQDLENQYHGEQQMGIIFNVFALLAIFISCLGLYGLSAYMGEQRIKEIGIRKVLGANVPGLIHTLSKDFFKFILIAFLVAVPLAWYLMHKWLEDFAFHISIKWWMFAGAGLIMTIITLATIGYQTIRTALANPINSLRSE